MTAEKEKPGDAGLTLAYLTSNLTAPLRLSPTSPPRFLAPSQHESRNPGGGDSEIEIVPTRYTRPILSDEMLSACNPEHSFARLDFTRFDGLRELRAIRSCLENSLRCSSRVLSMRRLCFSTFGRCNVSSRT